MTPTVTILGATPLFIPLVAAGRPRYEGIDAESPEAAAAIARGKPTGDVDDLDDCDGDTFCACVDVQGDSKYEQSRWIDFEPEYQRKAASALLAALASALDYLKANDDGEEDVVSRIGACEAAIAEATAVGVNAAPPVADRHTLLAPLEAVLPYAESEAHSLEKLKDSPEAEEEAERAWKAVEAAQALIAEAKAAGITPAPATGNDHRSRFEIEHNPDENPDRVYVMVDGTFDVAVIRTDEGVVIDVYPKDAIEPIATTWAFDSDAGTGEAEGT